MGLWESCWMCCWKLCAIDLQCRAINQDSSPKMTRRHFSSLCHFFVWAWLCLYVYVSAIVDAPLLHTISSVSYTGISASFPLTITGCCKILHEMNVSQIYLLYSSLHWWRSQRGTYKMKLSVRLLPHGLYVVKKCYLMLPGTLFFPSSLSYNLAIQTNTGTRLAPLCL